MKKYDMKLKEDFLADQEFVRWVRDPSPELDTYWTNWIAVNPDSLSEFKLAKEILMSIIYTDPTVPNGKKQELLSRILKESPPLENRPNNQKNSYRTGNFFRWTYRVAAVFLFLFGIVWLISDVKLVEFAPKVELGERILSRSTNSGEKLQFSLDDGTRVWINSSTEIHYSTGNTSDRKVYLKGEAYFEVSHDTLRPFKVFAGDLVTTVLGTSFNVSTKEQDRIKVSLLEGKISVSNSNSEIVDFLQPGEMLQYNKTKDLNTKHFFDVKEVSAWRNGIIIFKNSSLDDVLKKLEDWYGVEVIVENPRGKKWKVNAEYQNETLENILRSLSYVHKFRFEIDGKNVKLKL